MDDLDFIFCRCLKLVYTRRITRGYRWMFSNNASRVAVVEATTGFAVNA